MSRPTSNPVRTRFRPRPPASRRRSARPCLEVSRDVRVDLKLAARSHLRNHGGDRGRTLADTSDATLNGVLSNKAITELPVQGRDFQNLLELASRRAAHAGRRISLGHLERQPPRRQQFLHRRRRRQRRLLRRNRRQRCRHLRALPPAFCRSMPFRNSTRRKVRPPTTASSPAWS